MSQSNTAYEEERKVSGFALTFIEATGIDRKTRRELTAAKTVYPPPRPPKQYDNVWLWRFWPKIYVDFETFAEALKAAAPKAKYALIRGAPVEGLNLKEPQHRYSAKKRGGDRTIDDEPRNWSVFDVDGATVPTPFGDPDQLRAAAEWFRDNAMPAEFRDGKCVVTATASTGRKGPDKLHARLYFRHPYSLSFKDYKIYTRGVAEKEGIELDASVCLPGQVIYTARPVFEGLSDPVPPEDWVFVLDGLNDEVTLDLKKYIPAGKRAEGRLAGAARGAKGDYRVFARETVGRRGLEIGDFTNTFHEPLIKALGFAARSADSNETIADFLLDLVAERGPSRVERYNQDWVLDTLHRFQEQDEEERNTTPGTGARPRIFLTIKISDNATRAQEVLKAATPPLYQRGDHLVRALVEEVDAAHGRKTMVARLRDIKPVYLRDLIDRTADCFQYDTDNERWVAAPSPSDIATTILERGPDEWDFPVVRGVISTPTMRPDGSLLTTPGYDAATRLLLIEPPLMPPMPDNPGREDALRGLALLDDLLVEFPLKDEVSKAVALSGFITPVVRGAFRTAPLHGAAAPVAGTGKSYLWDTASAIAIGQLMPVISMGANEEEMEKRLGAELMTAQPLISIDNVDKELGGAALCQVIERPIVHIRILGKSERVRIEAGGHTVYTTGNNLVIVGDLVRRVINAWLDAEAERPELRQFKADPVAKVMNNRGVYIAAALTICRAYILAGRPDRAPPLASFEGWSNVVRSALIWLGKADCVESINMAVAVDPERVKLRDMLSAWSAAIGIGKGYRYRLRDLIEASAAYPDLNAAVGAIDSRGKPDIRSLGDWARYNQERRLDGLRLVVDLDRKHGSYWWVEDGTGEDKPPTIPAAFVTITTQIKTETEKAVQLAGSEMWLPKSMIKIERMESEEVKITLTRRLAAEKTLLKGDDPF